MRVTALALLVPVLLGSISSLAFAEPVGEATRVQRFAYQTPPQAAQAPLYKLDPVVRNAKLETVPSGALEVKFTDGSRLTLEILHRFPNGGVRVQTAEPGLGIHMMPRSDGIVLGGTAEHDVWTFDVNEAERTRIVEGHIQLFEGMG